MNIAVMQPYYFPYIGYFQLIAEVDIFVILDDVQYIRRGWINRNRILLNGCPHSMCIPVNSVERSMTINKIRIADDSERSLTKLFELLRHAYEKCPGWKQVRMGIKPLELAKPGSALLPILEKSIEYVCEKFNIRTTFIRASAIGGAEYSGVRRILYLMQRLGGKRYINPIGGIKLYKDEMFVSNNIELLFLLPNLASYPQRKISEFIPSLSVLDILANVERNKFAGIMGQRKLVTLHEALERNR